MIQRYNSDLANGLGNLASRTLTMIKQYRDGVIPGPRRDHDVAQRRSHATWRPSRSSTFRADSRAIWAFISWADGYIVEQAPWKLAKNPDAQQRLDETLYTAAETLRIVTALVYPVIPQSAAKIWAQLGMSQPIESVRLANLKWGQLPVGQKIGEVTGIFPRLDLKATVEKLWEAEAAEKERQAALLGKSRRVPDSTHRRNDQHRRFRQGGSSRWSW